jgi:hypothetical protein
MKKISPEKTANAARAESIFKTPVPKAQQLSEQELEKSVFDRNRERLKAERLAREALAKHE